MNMQRLAAALHRVESILKRRPEAARYADSPAVASWDGGTRSQACSPVQAAATRALPVKVSVEVLGH